VRQAVWTGSIAFGLVNIPVKLYPATEPKDVRFHLFDRRSGKRVRYERVARADEPPAFVPEPEYADDGDATDPADAPAAFRDIRAPEVSDRAPLGIGRMPEFGAGRPDVERQVEATDIVRGFSLPSGDLVTVSEEELDGITPERSRTIDIEEFVDLAEIDPVFFDKTYYVAPTRAAGSERPYMLLLRAMQTAGMVAIGRFVLRTRPHLVAIRPLENALALETLFFADEVRRSEDIVGGVPAAPVSERELKTAQQLIRTLATEWIPERHADQYREELLDLLRSKTPATAAEAADVVTTSPVDDLMAALKASVEAAKRRSATEYPAGTRRRGQRAREAR
jgi:DNA end-binding protein Ku